MGASGVASVVIAHMKLAKHSRYRAPAEGAGVGADGRDGRERERRRVRGEMGRRTVCAPALWPQPHF